MFSGLSDPDPLERDTDPDPVSQMYGSADPDRIRTKMSRIRNTGFFLRNMHVINKKMYHFQV
jgi:hypothetical protein